MAVEILYISGSSLDQKGKRIMVREGTVENWLWPEASIDLVDTKLLGLTEADRRGIERFFTHT